MEEEYVSLVETMCYISEIRGGFGETTRGRREGLQCVYILQLEGRNEPVVAEGPTEM